MKEKKADEYQIWEKQAYEMAISLFPGVDLEVTEAGEVHILNSFIITPPGTVIPLRNSLRL